MKIILATILFITFYTGFQLGNKTSYWRGIQDGVYSVILYSISEETEIASAE